MSTFFRFAFQGEEGYGLMESGVGEKITGSPWAGFQRTGQPINLSEITFLPPCQPTKIVCLGLNYRAHAREFDSKLPTEPLIFLKPPSALIGHLGEIAYPSLSARVDFEGELAVIMGKTCKNVSENRAMDFVLGYTCLNDVTARDLQRKDGQWARSKGFDTFCPAGPYRSLGSGNTDFFEWGRAPILPDQLSDFSHPFLNSSYLPGDDFVPGRYHLYGHPIGGGPDETGGQGRGEGGKSRAVD
jgi:Fumarylacetoacetate (FAA) hydrolase family/Rv2993c-like, N-terminal